MTLYSADLSACWMEKTPQTEKLKQKALLGDLAMDFLLMLRTVLKGALPVVNKVFSLPRFGFVWGFFSTFLARGI